MNVAEQIVNQLVDAGVHRIYGIVGDSLNPIVDAVRKTGGSKKGGIDWIHVRHEEAAAFAASALCSPLARNSSARCTSALVGTHPILMQVPPYMFEDCSIRATFLPVFA